ncbi:response regulator transcription factor [Paraburkholderia sp. HP33-1]|uniref:response regulator transcription factor n=1 Tax=Paraburkholderia sp. HP33-1 TaxID=2883243 RepID=UPI001F3C9122|nr:response regulator transcription factor [Paraburkholderia sp. HP33-1]
MQPANTGQEPRTIRIALVEDDAGFADALSHAVLSTPDLRLTGVAGTLAEGLAMLDGSPPDVLLVDLWLPDGAGVDVIRAAVPQWTTCNVMVSINPGDEAHVMRSIKAGASGYLLKDSSPARIVDEIRRVASGGNPVSPIVVRQILTRLRQSGAESSKPKVASAPLLSAREKEVLDLITKGFKAHEIAELMQLSPFTVKTFTRRIYSKLKVTSKAEAIYEARTLGLLSD